jgi:uncharacterized membrane protein
MIGFIIKIFGILGLLVLIAYVLTMLGWMTKVIWSNGTNEIYLGTVILVAVGVWGLFKVSVSTK